MSEGMIPGLIVVGFLVVFAMLIYFGHAQAKKRREGFRKFAARMGFRLTEDSAAPPEAIQAGFSLFSRGRSRRARNLVRGSVEGVNVCAFDYSFTTGNGKHSKTHSQTVLLLSSDGAAFPRFTLNPENFLHRIGEMLGFEDIDFTHAPHFSNRYRLSGPNAAEVRQAFNSSVLAMFEKIDGISAEGEGRHLLVYQQHNYLDPDSELEPSIRRAIEIMRAFR